MKNMVRRDYAFSTTMDSILDPIHGTQQRKALPRTSWSVRGFFTGKQLVDEFCWAAAESPFPRLAP